MSVATTPCAVEGLYFTQKMYLSDMHMYMIYYLWLIFFNLLTIFLSIHIDVHFSFINLNEYLSHVLADFFTHVSLTVQSMFEYHLY